MLNPQNQMPACLPQSSPLCGWFLFRQLERFQMILAPTLDELDEQRNLANSPHYQVQQLDRTDILGLYAQ